MEKPKLLLVADTFYPKVDGTLKFMEEFIKRAYNDFHISLLVPKLDNKKHKTKHLDKITYIKPYKKISLSGYPSMKFSFNNFKRIKTAIKEAEIVFVQGPALLSFISMYYAHKYEKKVISYTHVLSWEVLAKFVPLPLFLYSLARKINLFFFNYCDKILVPYHDLKDELKKNGIKVPMVVTKLGVDIKRFFPSKDKKESKKKIGIKSEKKVIGYVGRISKEKNVQIILDAFNKLEDKDNLQLLLVGDGPKDQVKEFKKLNNCILTGFVNNVEKYLKAMDIFIMPSSTETTSLATLEAMSTGLGVIASKVGFIKNYLIKDYNGIFFSKNSSTMLAMKIEKLLANPELVEKLGNNARKTIAYSFSWERSINKIKRNLLH